MAFRFFLFGLFLPFSLLMAPAVEAQDSMDGVTLRVAMDGDIRSTNAGVQRDANTDTILHHIVESLVAYRDDLTIAPLLAESYEVSGGGRIYTFHLRRDVTFHNGVELKAEHVKWSWERYLDPKTGWQCRSWYDGTGENSVRIVSIETPDPHTVVFTLESPSYIFLHRMAHLQCITAIIHPASVDANGKWVQPVGTGPFKYQEWRRGEYIELTRFEDYKSGPGETSGLVGSKKVLIDKLKFMIIPDASIAKSALLAGDVDVAISLPLSLYDELKSVESLQLVVQPTMGWMTLLVQTNAKVVNNKLIREAIAHAINRRALAKYATQGFGKENSAAVPDQSPYYDESYTDWYSYNPEKAKALLKQAGYKGEPIVIQTNRKQLHLFEGAIILHSMLRDVGINAKLEVLDWATQLNNYFSGNYQLSSFDYSARTEPSLNYGLIARKRGGSQPFGWKNSDVDDILQNLDLVFDDAERSKYFKLLHQELKKDIPIIGLYNLNKMVALRKEISGFNGWRLEKPRFWGVSKTAKPPKVNSTSAGVK